MERGAYMYVVGWLLHLEEPGLRMISANSRVHLPPEPNGVVLVDAHYAVPTLYKLVVDSMYKLRSMEY